MRKHWTRRGTMLLEAAIVLPFLIVLLFGLLEYGWIFVKVEQINNAARHGARIGALVGKTNADVQSGVDALMTNAGIGGYSVTFFPPDISTPGTGETVTITVTVPYQGADVELLGVPLIPVPATLQSSVSMAKEGM